jgi:uncharacterized SAM-binding protein YcdF (DUF218 family)
MSIAWLITNFIAAFLLPPLNLIVLGGLGLYFLQRRRNLGKWLIALSLGGLTVLSLPIVSGALLDALMPPLVKFNGSEADAIVILGGGINPESLEYGGPAPGSHTLERLRYGAWLARKLGKPILVTGGHPAGGEAEGRVMRDTLERDFGLKVRWVEDQSNNTRENGRFSSAILKQDGIRRIYLVSDAWHLTRAIPEFEREGLQVFAAGTGYAPYTGLHVLDFLPNAGALNTSSLALHEGIGILWYHIRN